MFSPIALVRSACAAALLSVLLSAAAPGQAAAAVTPPNSADRMLVWVRCDDVAAMSDAALDAWRARGVSGFVCMTAQLAGMGGVNWFTADVGSALDGPRYALERRLRDSHLVDRLHARGMVAYLGGYLVNYWNSATPLADWFDDAAWRDTVLPSMSHLAGAARALGFAGVAFDQELYGQEGGRTDATWNWNYPGNSRTEAAVRQQARERGREVMRALLAADPGVKLLAYDVELPGSWGDFIQNRVNGPDATSRDRLDIDFWDGLSSVEGYGSIGLLDASFYKEPQMGSWDTALQYSYNSLYASLSRRLSNWSYASSHLFVSPFGWIDPGPTPSPFDDARSPAYVAEQLAAFRKWGMERTFADYSYGGLDGFDYSPYAGAMEAASRPGVVDSQPPALTVGTALARGSQAVLSGTVSDNLAVRFVRWTAPGGVSGTARMTWQPPAGEWRGGAGRTEWSAAGVPLRPGVNRIEITAVDIKGLETRRTLTVAGRAAGRDQAPPARPAKARCKRTRHARRRKSRRARHRRSHRHAARARCTR